MTVHLFNVQSRDESWLKVDSAVNQTAEVKEVYTVYIRKMRSRYFLFLSIKVKKVNTSWFLLEEKL